MMKLHLPEAPRQIYRLSASFLFFIMGMLFASWASRIPDIQANLALTDGQLGSALLGAPLAQLPVMLIAGWLVGRFGSRNVLSVALALYALALTCLGFVQSFNMLFFALMMFGASGNLYNNAVNTQAVGIERLYGRSVMASMHGMWSLGGVAGALCGALLAALYISPRTHFILTCIFAMLAMLILRRYMLPRDSVSIKPDNGLRHEEKDERVQENAKKRTREKALNRMPDRKDLKRRADYATSISRLRPDLILIILGFIALANMAIEGTMYDWSSVYFAKVVGAPNYLVRLGYLCCMLASVSVRFIADSLITRFGSGRVLQGSGLIMTLGLTVMIIFPSLVPAAIGAAMVGCGMASGIPICFSLAGRSKRVSPSVAISIVTAVSFFGFLLCPPLIGHLSEAFSLRIAFVPIAVMGLATVIFATLLKRKLR